MKYIGDFLVGSTVNIYFSSNDINGGRAAFSTPLEIADILIYKNVSTTEETVAGVAASCTLDDTHDARVGIHSLAIDLSNDEDTGFYAAGNDYTVILYPDETLDGQNISAVLCQFSIQNRYNAIVANNLDHLLKVAVSNRDTMPEVVDDTILANLMTKTDGDTSDFDHETDSLEAIRDAITEVSPQVHAATADNITTGTRDAGTDYENTETINGSYFQTSPVTPAVGGFGLNVDLTFSVGTGLSRVPAALNITGYFDAVPARDVHVWARNYLSSSYDQLSDSGSAMDGKETSNKNYQYLLNNNHVQTSDGEVKIRFTATSTTGADNLYLDYVAVSSVAVEAAGLTAEAIAEAVSVHDVSNHTEHNSLGFRVGTNVIEIYNVTTSDTATSFTCTNLPDVTDFYKGHHIRVHDITGEQEADSWILSMDNAGVVTLGRALPFTPDTLAHMYVMAGMVTITEIQSGLATAAALSTHDGKLDTVAAYIDTEVQAIKDKTDNLPGDPASETNVNANETKIDALPTAAAIVAAIKAMTGITEGGTWTWEKIMKITTAFMAGDWRVKATDASVQQLMDAENGTTVILEQSITRSPATGSKYRDITVKI